MRVLILGAGVQGTLFGVWLARAGHDVTLIARGARAQQLRTQGAAIENALTGVRDCVQLPVIERLDPDANADICLVTVRREQLAAALNDLRAVNGLKRVVFMVNHAAGSAALFDALGRSRVVLAFAGAAGSIEGGIDRYVEVAEQPTVVESTAPDIAVHFRNAGLRVVLVRDMDSWLKRHAVFVTAMSGALYAAGGTARGLAACESLVRSMVLAVREGWAALDRAGVGSEPLALRTIFRWAPVLVGCAYWRRLLATARGEYYFGRHARHAVKEMAALGDDVRLLVGDCPAPHLLKLLEVLDQRASN